MEKKLKEIMLLFVILVLSGNLVGSGLSFFTSEFSFSSSPIECSDSLDQGVDLHQGDAVNDLFCNDTNAEFGIIVSYIRFIHPSDMFLFSYFSSSVWQPPKIS